MLRLLTDTPNQNAYLTLDEARQYFSTSFTHYLFILRHEENSAAGVYLAQVLDVIAENQRITQVAINTTGLTLIGRYRYDVYGQSSASNLNPEDVSVVGLCEQGLCELRDDRSFFTVPNIDINNDIVFNGQ